MSQGYFGQSQCPHRRQQKGQRRSLIACQVKKCCVKRKLDQHYCCTGRCWIDRLCCRQDTRLWQEFPPCVTTAPIRKTSSEFVALCFITDSPMGPHQRHTFSSLVLSYASTIYFRTSSQIITLLRASVRGVRL